MNKIAVIGGSHFTFLPHLDITHSTEVKTPFGDPSAPLGYGILGDQEVIYLPRRGPSHAISAHKINYRANIWALRDAGVQTIIATAAVATVSDDYLLGDIIIPNQLIDYTYRRENSFMGSESSLTLRDFAEPYTEHLRQKIIAKATSLNYTVATQGIVGIMQGPRLETLAELKRYAQEGCDFLGMSGMPEAALARELDLDYACILQVVRKAGQCPVTINDNSIEKLIEAFIQSDARDDRD